MEHARSGQEPEFLIISSIHPSAQDLQMLGMLQGDASHSTRVTGHPILHSSEYLFLFSGPAAYNSHFPRHAGVIIAFDENEPQSIINESLYNIAEHPSIDGIPILAFLVNYEDGIIHSIEHDYLRDASLEESLYQRVVVPLPIDPSCLILLCSDSRVQPPVFPEGMPLAIQTLGAHIPRYDKNHGECTQFDAFFKEWFSICSPKQILIIKHGGFVVECPHCSAAEASINANAISERFLSEVISAITSDASRFEDELRDDPKDGALALAKATEANIRSYPAIEVARRNGIDLDELIFIIAMDTLTGRILEIG